MTRDDWFEISHDGWRHLSASRPLGRLLLEAIQNAFDEQAARVRVALWSGSALDGEVTAPFTLTVEVGRTQLKVRDILAKKGNEGFNAATAKFEDLVKAGVIDPTKVTRTALQNAASVASLMLTTECVVVEKKEDEPAAPAPPGGGMGGMY